MRAEFKNYLDIYFTKFLEKYYKLLKKFRSENSKVLISGMPRGGTTWLAELLLNIDKSSINWEPLRPFRLYEIGLKSFSDELGWFPYIPENENWNEGFLFLKKLLNCELLNYKSILRRNSYRENLFDDFMIIKCVTANQMLPYINSNYNIKTIYLLRHPCAVVSSMIRFSAFKYIHNEIERYKDIKYSSIYFKYEHIIKKLESKEEKIAALWCLQNIVPLESKSYRNKRLTVFYEDLLVNPKEEIERIFKFIDKKIPSKVFQDFDKPSKTTKEGSEILSGGNQLSGWEKQLNKTQINQILKVLNSFNIDTYNEELLPNKTSRFNIY